MNFTNLSVNEINRYLTTLNQEELIKCLAFLAHDKRITVQNIVKSTSGSLTKGLKSWKDVVPFGLWKKKSWKRVIDLLLVLMRPGEDL